jgi:HAD superfamily hydrolase (TIGR01509 family)
MNISDFAGAIFDLDGTLTNNMGLHRRALGMFAAHHRLDHVTDELLLSMGGWRNSEIFPALFGRSLALEEFTGYDEHKEQLYRELAAGELAALPGLAALLDELARQGLPAAPATSAPAANVAFSLAALGLEGRFAAVVLGSEVPAGKPAPDIFLEAARRLGVPPERCVGFEDSYAGIEALKSAGMYCVALSTTLSGQELRAHDMADLIVEDFTALL